MSEMGDITSWFVAYVKYCHEKRVASLLEALGVEYYLPIQQIRRKWSDRVMMQTAWCSQAHLCTHYAKSSYLFVNGIPSMLGYMTICGAYTPVVVPEHQLELFRFMVENADENVYIETGPLSPGDHVRVKEGPLEGLECDLVEVEDRRCIAVGLGVIGNATLEISPSKLEKVKVT